MTRPGADEGHRELEQRLAEAEATIAALLAGEVDAVVDPGSATPLLLRKAQDALRESAERYLILFENSPLPKWLYSVQTLRFLAVNDAAVRTYGYSREEFLRMTIEAIRPPADVPAAVRAVRDAPLGPQAFGVWRHRKRDGTIFEVEITGQTFPLEGKLARLVVAQDVTERRRAEESLRASEERTRLILDSTGEGIYGVDLQNDCTFANAACLRMLGYRHERDLLGRNMHETTHHTREGGAPHPAEDCPVAKAGLQADGGFVPDELLWRADGTSFPAEFRSFPLRRDGERVGAVVSFADTSARRAAEKQVRLLHDIALAAGDAATLEETLGVVLRLLCQATGVQVANAWVPGGSGRLECRGQWARPEDRERFRTLAQGWSFAGGMGLPGSAWSQKTPQWADEVEQAPDFRRGALAAGLGLRSALAVPILAGEEVVAVVEVFLQREGEREAMAALLSAIGTQLGSVLLRRRAEDALHKSEAQLRQSQKMEAIGQLTGGVAHDFNNLLSIILSYSSLLADEMQADDPRRNDLLEIKGAGERAATLTRQLLAFSRQQVLQPRLVDLNQVVAGMEKMLRRLIGEDVELGVVPSAQPAWVSVDPGQMEQVLMNLVVNARDAMPRGGKLTIELGSTELDEAFALEHPAAVAGPHVMLAVSDTGVGMDEATQARVFEPFFTTKERGKGTGLGLSTVFGIVRQSAGTIWLYSEPGKGTAFKIYFPCATPGPELAPAPAAEPARLHGSEIILLVEDEAQLRKLVRSILERNGYRVLEASDGEQALQVAASAGAIDLLLTDVVMPRMGGAEAAARLCALRPGLKLLYMSGYTDNAVVLHGVLRAEAAFLQKPLTPLSLLTRLREVLDRPLGGRDGAAPRLTRP